MLCETERSVGFDTAVNTVTEALMKLSFTAASHDRVMVVEVMGRDAGHLALHSGIAGGADVILLPEIPFSIENVSKRLRRSKQLLGRLFAIIVVAEGAHTCAGQNRTYVDAAGVEHLRGIGEYVASELVKVSGELDSRVVVLGHVQRGGMPSALDRVLATAFGTAAVDALARGESDVMVAWQNNRVVTVPLADVVAAGAVGVQLDSPFVSTAIASGIYLGELPIPCAGVDAATATATTTTSPAGSS